ncbi:MAG: hypothetical protein Q7U72_08245 [Brevundimonas sp.]|uniref:hypothetical protein n=1 Tax=Brevundimonas sp. TaxID=1871086 RepID=UPI0027176898|nr:hypothetical protein [Brevundimonas sp.]MDO9077425.1 hypothetical protein [Brevundimonas sp.]MDP3080344.1 hypothetical protein [Brevundimonas sp.]MDZ4062673.1 hypothetical protein [Brevundimonas sp.]
MVALKKMPWAPPDKAIAALVMARVQLLFEDEDLGKRATSLILAEGDSLRLKSDGRTLRFNRVWVLETPVREIADTMRLCLTP